LRPFNLAIDAMPIAPFDALVGLVTGSGRKR
jgi:hypothetical protein